jgi:hypothetical protein
VKEKTGKTARQLRRQGVKQRGSYARKVTKVLKSKEEEKVKASNNKVSKQG